MSASMTIFVVSSYNEPLLVGTVVTAFCGIAPAFVGTTLHVEFVYTNTAPEFTPLETATIAFAVGAVATQADPDQIT